MKAIVFLHSLHTAWQHLVVAVGCRIRYELDLLPPSDPARLFMWPADHAGQWDCALSCARFRLHVGIFFPYPRDSCNSPNGWHKSDQLRLPENRAMIWNKFQIMALPSSPLPKQTTPVSYLPCASLCPPRMAQKCFMGLLWHSLASTRDLRWPPLSVSTLSMFSLKVMNSTTGQPWGRQVRRTCSGFYLPTHPPLCSGQDRLTARVSHFKRKENIV